jgi:hypothetical protein
VLPGGLNSVSIKLLLSCLVLAVSANAQTAPKVVFVGDSFTYGWQQSAAFTANQNWIGQGLSDPNWVDASTRVAGAFQTALNLHPAIVFIETGSLDVSIQFDSQPLGAEWESAADAIIQMVQMAKKANVKIIFGNVVAYGYNGDFFNGWLQTFAQAEGIPIVNFDYWLMHGCASVIPPPSNGAVSSCVLLNPPEDYPTVPVPNDMGYAFITQMAQTAIATYGLSIKSGYLSDMLVDDANAGGNGDPNVYQVNGVASGAGVQFTPQATWSDGVTRPMWNIPYNAFNNASMGTWWSTNPKVMSVDQQGHAVAYTSGTAAIWFKSASGVTFAPWTMTVGGWFSSEGLNEPVY